MQRISVTARLHRSTLNFEKAAFARLESDLAEAVRTEYKTIVEAGFILQIDDAWLVALWDRIAIAMGLWLTGRAT